MKNHMYCYFECKNCKDIGETRLDNLKEINMTYCRECASSPIIQFYTCKDCGKVVEVDNWSINHLKTPYCKTCSSKKSVKYMIKTRDKDYFEKSMKSRENNLIGKVKLISLQVRAKKVQEVKKDQESGMVFSPPLDIRVGDVVKCIL